MDITTESNSIPENDEKTIPEIDIPSECKNEDEDASQTTTFENFDEIVRQFVIRIIELNFKNLRLVLLLT